MTRMTRPPESRVHAEVTREASASVWYWSTLRLVSPPRSADNGTWAPFVCGVCPGHWAYSLPALVTALKALVLLPPQGGTLTRDTSRTSKTALPGTVLCCEKPLVQPIVISKHVPTQHNAERNITGR